ncbi:MAG TPA: hypothetical protein VMW76_03410 [Bacteroidales bacterium]|nr:hypothetical protein [Bacteroidales bacterium]
MRRFCASILFVLLPACLNAQEISVKSWVDSSRIFIGDQVFYNIEILQPPETKLFVPIQQDTLIDKIEVLSTSIPDTSLISNDQVKIIYRQLITSFDTGRYEIPPFYVELKTNFGVQRFFSGYSVLDVLRVDITPSDTTDVIFDIIGPRKAPITAGEILPWILLAILVVLIAYRTYKYITGREKKLEDDRSNMPTEPMHIIALRELDKLEKLKLWEKGEVKKHYSMLTETVRRYLDRRYLINSMEMTSSETLDSLKDIGFGNKEMTRILEVLFFNADLSKFARYVPDNEYNRMSIDHARHFIKETFRLSEVNDRPGSAADKERKEDEDE